MNGGRGSVAARRVRIAARGAPRASAALAAVLCLVACSEDPATHPDAGPTAARRPVVLIGVDGLEWSVLAPLLREGRLPNLRRLVEGGASGRLFTIKPTFSPTIWTSVVTGRRPEEHGIVHFLRGDGEPFTSSDRRVSALWNLATRYDRDVLCVGWWVTWPAEEIGGEMVAPFAAAGQDQGRWKGNLHPKDELADQTWPRDLIDEVEPVARAVAADHDQLLREERLFGDAALALTGLEAELIEQTRWSLRADESFLAITRDRLRRRVAEGRGAPDLTLVYFGAPDVASHRFWAFRHPDRYRFRIPGRSVEALGGVIDAFYEDADRKVGEVLEAVGTDANVIVCSDHGFHEYETETPSALGLTGHHMDGPAGVLIAHGPDIRRGRGAEVLEGDGRPLDLGRVYEVAPVVLALLGVPSARDLEVPDGGALRRNLISPDAGLPAPEVAWVDTHDPGFTPAARPDDAATGDASEALRAWMAQLGYLEGVGEDLLFSEVLPER